jgi:hypothetical protein
MTAKWLLAWAVSAREARRCLLLRLEHKNCSHEAVTYLQTILLLKFHRYGGVLCFCENIGATTGSRNKQKKEQQSPRKKMLEKKLSLYLSIDKTDAYQRIELVSASCCVCGRLLKGRGRAKKFFFVAACHQPQH